MGDIRGIWEGPVFRPVLATTGSPGLREEVDGVLVLDVSRPASLVEAVGDEDVPVVVTSHPEHEHATRLACTVLHGWREDLLVAHHAFAQTPLANLVALRITRELVADAGHAVATWRDLSESIWSAAVVGGVSRLPHPNPSLRQHARSLLPGSRYLVRIHPDADVIGLGQVPQALAPLGRGNVHVHATRTGDDDPLLRALVEQVAPIGVEQRELPGDWSRLFGRRELAQLALVPTAYQSMLRPRGAPCRSCGLAVADPVCSFCGIREPVGPGTTPLPAPGGAPVVPVTASGIPAGLAAAGTERTT